MHGLAYLTLVSRQRGDIPEPCSDETYFERLRWWCTVCSIHRVQTKDAVCPCCEDETP